MVMKNFFIFEKVSYANLFQKAKSPLLREATSYFISNTVEENLHHWDNFYILVICE